MILKPFHVGNTRHSRYYPSRGGLAAVHLPAERLFDGGSILPCNRSRHNTAYILSGVTPTRAASSVRDMPIVEVWMRV